MAVEQGTIERLLLLAARGLGEIADELQPSEVADTFTRLGLVLPASVLGAPPVSDAIAGASGAGGAINAAAQTLESALTSGTTASVADAVQSLVKAVSALVDALNGISTALKSIADQVPGVSGDVVRAFADDLTGALFDGAIIDVLESELPNLTRLSNVAAVIDRYVSPGVPSDPAQPPFLVRRLRLSRLSKLLFHPVDHFQTTYGWGSDFNESKLFPRLQNVIDSFGILTSREAPGTTPPQITTLFLTIQKDASVSPSRVNLVPGLNIPGGLNFNTSLTDGFSSTLSTTGGISSGAALAVAPPLSVSLASAPAGAQLGVSFVLKRSPKQGEQLVQIFGLGGGPRCEASFVEMGASLQLVLSGAQASGQIGFNAKISGGKLTLGFGEDGFLSGVLGGRTLSALFDLAATWTVGGGLVLTGSGGVELVLVLNQSVGVGTLQAVRLALRAGNGDDLLISAGADLSLLIGPVTAGVTGLGVALDVTFPGSHGNLGAVDVEAQLKPPSGLAISINAGSVSGGGFISFDPEKGRYFGALELSVYGIAVKAFGIIETKVPGVSYSFLIIISADFTPVQLGLGFTLNGVGGLAGINRTVDQKGLLEAVRGGRIETALFPHDVVHDAPAIIHDVGVLFPPTAGHYVFGPLAKIGWGTPTLVEADLGLILEFPGPRLVVLGTVHAALPTKEEALVELNLDVAGLIDFPKKYFSLDASLHDSRVGDFPVSGDMAMRLTWGPNPNFALAVGGFNPHYNPPPSFPKLRPVTVDLGQHGNPSINLHGYMALTSNTAQVGAQLEARVSGGGAELYGFLGFDALFVFSPFSFMADIEGGVKVSFHGHGFSLHFHGHVSGPSPWHLDGKVCVSILFWDACVGFSLNLGGSTRAVLPGLDPWNGQDDSGHQRVSGLRQALEDPKNWAGGAPPASTNVVTLVAASPGAAAPVDPLGSATVRQKAVPLDVPVTRFAGTKPLKTAKQNFKITEITIGQTITPGQDPQSTASVANPDTVSDFFAPAEFQAMKDADKLSSPSFTQMAAGVTFSSDAIKAGSVGLKDLTYHTIVFAEDGSKTENDDYSPTSAQVTSTTAISAVALAGIRAAALARYLDPTGKPKVTPNAIADGYVLSSISTLKVAPGFSLNKPVPRPAAVGALLAAALTDPTAFQTLQVTPVFNALP